MSSRQPVGAVYPVLGLLFATLGVLAIVNAFVPLSLATVGIVLASAFTVAGLIGMVVALCRPTRD